MDRPQRFAPIFLAATLISSGVLAADATPPASDEVKQTRSSIASGIPGDGGVSMTEPEGKPFRDFKIIPAPFYTPDTSFGAALIATYFFKYRGYPQARASSVTNALGVTAKKQLQFTQRGNFYLKNNDWYLWYQVQAKIWPDTFQGFGNDVPEETEGYLSRHVMALGSVQRRVWKDLYFGPFTEMHYLAPTNFEAGGALQTGNISGTTNHVLNWSGLNLVWDNRSSPNFPVSGGMYGLELGAITDLNGGPLNNFRMNVDLRQFASISDDHVFAFRVNLATGAGPDNSLPFTLMRGIGGEVRLRGLPLTKYRDHSAIWGMAEYRLRISPRWGTVFYTGAGQVARMVRGFTLDGFHPVVGTGIRFAIVPAERVNIRVDIATAGNGNIATYVVAGEAF